MIWYSLKVNRHKSIALKIVFNHYPESIEQKAHIGLHSIMRLRSEEKIFHDRASLFTCLWIFEKNVKQEIFLPEF